MNVREIKPEDKAAVLMDSRKKSEISPNAAFGGLEQQLNRIVFGDFVLDHQRGALLKDNEEIALRPKTFTFLSYLAENPGRLISKNELIEAVWPNVMVTEDSLVQCVAELRRVLSDNDQKLIKTVPKRGYLFDVEVLQQPSDIKAVIDFGQQERPCSNLTAPSKYLRTDFIKPSAAIAAFCGLFLVAIAVLFAWPQSIDEPAGTPSLSVVVLPFANLSGDPGQDDFATGLTNDLTSDLSRYSSLLVIAPATAQTFKGNSSDIRQISRELNVRYIMQGDVRHVGEQIRINVQLIDGNTGQTRWAERFSRERENIPEWQDEVVSRIAIALDHRLTILEGERVSRERPDNPEAFDLTARGWATVYAGKHADNYHSALALFRQALQLNPHALSAKAGIAWSTGILLLNGWSVSSEEDMQTATIAVTDLLKADPDHVIAHHVRGFLLRYQRRTEAAREAFSTAVSINPNFAPSHAQLGVSELEMGRPDKAIESAKRALRLSPRDPNSRSWFAFVGMAELHSGRPADAVPWLARATDVDQPVAIHHAYYISALVLSGQVDDARSELAGFQKAKPSVTIGSLRSGLRSENPHYITQREPLFDGLRKAGLPE